MSAAPEPTPRVALREYAPSAFELMVNIRREGGFLGFLLKVWREHGDLVMLKIGGRSVLLVADPDLVQHINVTGRDKWDKGASYDGLRDKLLGDGIVTATGVSWRRQRKLMAPFFTPKGIAKYFPIFVADTERMMERWRAGCAGTGKPVEILDEMMGVTASVILHAVFSTESGPTLDKVRHNIEFLVTESAKGQSRPVSLPSWVPTPNNVKYKRAYREVTDYIRELINQRQAIPQDQWPDDLLTDLMVTKEEETNTTMAEQLLVDNGLTMFAAGHETTARTLSFLWYALSQNPEVEARLHAEVDEVLGDEAPTLEAMKQLPYTLRVVREVLRLYPAAPLYARDAIEDDVLAGVPIPKGTPSLPFAYATHRHPAVWQDPERFDPDRWLPEREAERPASSFHAFATGPRICLGSHFSLLETHIMTAMIARRFRIRNKPGHVPHVEFFGTLGSKNGLPMLIEER